MSQAWEHGGAGRGGAKGGAGAKGLGGPGVWRSQLRIKACIGLTAWLWVMEGCHRYRYHNGGHRLGELAHSCGSPWTTTMDEEMNSTGIAAFNKAATIAKTLDA